MWRFGQTFTFPVASKFYKFVKNTILRTSDYKKKYDQVPLFSPVFYFLNFKG